MKKTKQILLTTALIAMSSAVVAQNWGNSAFNNPTFTTDNVGIGYGTAFPVDCNLGINNILGSGIPSYGVPALKITRDWPLMVSGSPVWPNHMEIWWQNPAPMCWPIPCPPPPPTLIDVIDPNGWYGILTPHPTEALDVNGNVRVEKNLAVNGGQVDLQIPGDGMSRNINANSTNSGLNLTAGTHGASISLNAGYNPDRPGCMGFITTGPYISDVGSSTGPTGYMFYWYGTHTNDPESWHNLMHIWNDGKVTIGEDIDDWWENQYGLTPDGYKLFVSGGILTEKLKVAIHGTSDWSDYVFNKNYNLMSLNNVESYIKANKHLPDMPSAEEVVKSGLDVASMDAKLLQKIEELTLYVIQQQKELESQHQEILVLKKDKQIDSK